MKRSSVIVRVPGSTSNLGSGFDTLGLALRLHNRVRVSLAPGKALRIVSRMADADRLKAAALVTGAARLFFRRLGESPVGLEVAMEGDVPAGRGLGASATARVGIIAALNTLTRAGLSRQQWLELVTELEGHPDNASPAIFGGFTVSGSVDGAVRCFRFPVNPRLKFVTLIPRFEISTEESRKLIPRAFSRTDTAHSLNRAALITAAFARGDYGGLRALFDDRLHQPYRQRLIPQLARVIEAGEKAGAIGGWLSGSGSAIMCLTLEKPLAIARAMQKQLPDSRVKVLGPDNGGTKTGR